MKQLNKNNNNPKQISANPPKDGNLIDIMLNSDAFYACFEFLSVKEGIRAELVCKRWKKEMSEVPLFKRAVYTALFQRNLIDDVCYRLSIWTPTNKVLFRNYVYPSTRRACEGICAPIRQKQNAILNCSLGNLLEEFDQSNPLLEIPEPTEPTGALETLRRWKEVIIILSILIYMAPLESVCVLIYAILAFSLVLFLGARNL